MSKKKLSDADVITHKSYDGTVLQLCQEKGWQVGDILEIHPDYAAKPPPAGRAPKDIPAYENLDDETGFRVKITAIPEFSTDTPPVPLNPEARDAQYISVEWPEGSGFVTALSPTCREWVKV